MIKRIHVSSATILRLARGEPVSRWHFLMGGERHLEECDWCANRLLEAQATLAGEDWFAEEYQPDDQEA